VPESIEKQIEMALARSPLVVAVYDADRTDPDEIRSAVERAHPRAIMFRAGYLRPDEIRQASRVRRPVVIAAEDVGPDLPALREELAERDFEEIRIIVPDRPHLAGYQADTDVGIDRLGITPDVNMLADLVASRLIRPPLSIGLFGNWGSGKSFFMRQLRKRVRHLADSAAEAEKAEHRRGQEVSSYCAGVRQITFNAWHYAEANLWASLAAHIFDNLASDGSEDDLARRADQLHELRGKEKSLLTQLSAVRLERMMVAAQHEREPFTLDLTHDDFRWVAKALDVPEASIAQVREFATGILGFKAKARQVLSLFRRSKLAWILLGAGIALTVGFLVLVNSPLWPALTALVSTVVAAVTPIAREVHKAAGRIRDAAQTKEAATGQRLADLDAETDRLERAVSELATARDVAAYAQQRHATDDYQQYLGVVSLLRRDLETFAAILDEERKSDGGLERIVLYVDDLDRCAPDVVVKVLEAIHLLVALPVFVVVVAVDARWLRQAIERHYDKMNLSPSNYLEKIFQIPFQLPAMDHKGFAGLMWALSGTERRGEEAPAPGERPGPERREVEPAPQADDPQLRPRQLDISEAEMDFLSRLGPLVPSPRAAKRLINLYRLLRARLWGRELDAFVDGDGAAAVLVLLAVHAGEGTAAEGLFGRIEAAGSGMTSWPALLDRYREDADVATLCAQLTEIDGMPGTLAVYREWLPLVRRFSFGY
jgi:KAP family P-loop domain